MIDRTLRRDRRAVTPAITHVLTIAFTTILVMGLLMGAGGFLDSEERSSARQELDAIGNRLADEIDRVDNLAEDGSRVSITTRHPEEITGGGYTISFEKADPGDPGDSWLVLQSHGTDASARVPVRNDTAVSVEHTGGGTFNLTANDPMPTAATTANPQQTGLNLRVGVASDIREDPLGSRLVSRNVPPIPLFDVEPQPATTASTHFLNGSSSLDQDGNVTEHKWDIGNDGLYTKVGEIAPHWFDSPGKHEVTLRVADDAQDTASGTLTKNVTVSGLEYNHNLREGANESIRFSMYNNWSKPVRLDSLFVDDLRDNVDVIGDCDNVYWPTDDFNSEVNIDVDSDGNRDTYVEYRDETSWGACRDVAELPDEGATVDIDQVLPDAETSAPSEVPVVQPNDHVTIQISGLESDLEGSEWRLGVAYLVDGHATETVFADRAGSPHISDFSVEENGDDLTISFASIGEVDDIAVDLAGPDSASLDEGDFSQSNVGPAMFEYEATVSNRDSGVYRATLTRAETTTDVNAYGLPLHDDAIAVNDDDDAVWTSASDWDNITASSGIVHETFGDHVDSELSLGYSWSDAGGDDLTAYWPMDGDHLDRMEDWSSPGTNSGDTTDIFNRTVGLFGTSSYAFTSGSSQVEVSSTDALSGGENATLTVSTWIHPREAISNSDGAAIIGKLNATAGGDWGIVMNSSCPDYADGGCDGTPTIGYYGGTESEEYALMHGPVTKPDAWHHVAFVLDGPNDELDLYYDGRIVESIDGIPDFASANTSRDILVGHHPRTGETYDGYVDETRIYNRTLSSGEVQDLAETSTQGTITTDWTNTSNTVTVSDLNLTAGAELNGGSVVVRVETDEGELSDPIRLTDDEGSYEITGLSTDADGFRLEVDIESRSKNRSPMIDSLVVHERP